MQQPEISIHPLIGRLLLIVKNTQKIDFEIMKYIEI